MRKGASSPLSSETGQLYYWNRKYTPCKQKLNQYNENRDWHLNSIEIGTLQPIQDAIKSYSSYICHTSAIKNTQTNSIPPFLQNPPFLRSTLPFNNLSILPFLRFLVRSMTLKKKRRGGGGGPNYAQMFNWSKFNNYFCFIICYKILLFLLDEMLQFLHWW